MENETKTQETNQQTNPRPTTASFEHNLIDGEINKALAKAQGSMKNPTKDMTNPHFRSKYASLDSVIEATRKPLADNGLSFTQSVDIIGQGWVSVTSILSHGLEWMKWKTKMATDTSSPQKFGSSCTYARRYARMDIFGLAGDEDDDGNAASEPKGKPQSDPRSQGFPRPTPKPSIQNDMIAGL